MTQTLDGPLADPETLWGYAPDEWRQRYGVLTPEQWAAQRDAMGNLARLASAENARRWDAQYGLDRDRLRQEMRIARMQTGDSRDATRQRMRAEAAKIKYAYDELAQLGVPRLELDRWRAEKANEIALAELELKRGDMGLDLLKTAASLRGPENYFQGAEFYAGAQQNLPAQNWIQALAQSQRGGVGAGPAPGVGTVTPATLGSVAANFGYAPPPGVAPSGNPLTGGAGAPPASAPQGAPPQAAPFARPALSPADQQRLQDASTALRRPQDWAPGEWEAMGKTRRALLGSAGDYLGYDMDEALDVYKRWQPNQGAGTAY